MDGGKRKGFSCDRYQWGEFVLKIKKRFRFSTTTLVLLHPPHNYTMGNVAPEKLQLSY